MTCPAVLERNRDLTAATDTTPARSLPPCVSGEPICPMTNSTTCTDDEDLQRQCPSC